MLRQSAERQLAACDAVRRAIGGRKVTMLATIGRGSSDHAATFLRYACEIFLGVPGASISPSISSICGRQLTLEGALCLALSQSGRSPDIVKTAAMAKAGGALVVAIVNDESSPLAQVADVVVPMAAGPERAVAATKSFVSSAIAGLRLLGVVADDAAVLHDLRDFPDVLEETYRTERFDLSVVLAARSAYVVGRGPALGIAQEAALKLKEIVQFPAEAFSSAEVRHGPWQLANTDSALVSWKTDAACAPSQQEVLADYAKLGRTTLDLQGVGPELGGGMGAALSALLPLPSFYRALVLSARNLGLDPDNPSLLRKVTATV